MKIELDIDDFDIVTLTPDLASQMLERNTANRAVSARIVDAYVRSMKKGEWRDDLAPPIKVGVGGVVIDGQHRLHAVVISGVTIQSAIQVVNEESCFGLPIDIGKKRTPSNILSGRGEIVSPRIAQIARAAAEIVKWEEHKKQMEISELLLWHRLLGESARQLIAAHGTAAKNVATAGVRLGFCLAVLGACGKVTSEMAIKEYGLLIKARLEEAAFPSMPALYRRLQGERAQGGERMVTDAYLTVKAFEYPKLRRLERASTTTEAKYVAGFLRVAEERYGRGTPAGMSDSKAKADPKADPDDAWSLEVVRVKRLLYGR